MLKRLILRLMFSKKIILTLILVSFFLVSCGPQLQSIRILPDRPADHTIHSSYPNIKKVYQSDKEVILVSSWRSSGSSEGNRIRWEIWTPKGELAYSTTDKKINIRRNLSFYQTIRLDENVEEKYPPGVYTIKLYLDNQLIKSQAVEYFDKSIINTSLNGAVILPFSFRGPSQVNPKVFLNTTTHALYGAVRRRVEGTVPPVMAAIEFGDDFSQNILKIHTK
jgi:hypothetical protein